MSGVFLIKEHPAIQFGQTVEVLWEENHNEESGFAIYPHGGLVKSNLLARTIGQTVYFNVPQYSIQIQ